MKRVAVKLPNGKIRMVLETASAKAPENASKPNPLPKHVGGGWYEVRGEKVKGKKAAEKVMKAGD